MSKNNKQRLEEQLLAWRTSPVFPSRPQRPRPAPVRQLPIPPLLADSPEPSPSISLVDTPPSARAPVVHPRRRTKSEGARSRKTSTSSWYRGSEAPVTTSCITSIEPHPRLQQSPTVPIHIPTSTDVGTHAPHSDPPSCTSASTIESRTPLTTPKKASTSEKDSACSAIPQTSQSGPPPHRTTITFALPSMPSKSPNDSSASDSDDYDSPPPRLSTRSTTKTTSRMRSPHNQPKGQTQSVAALSPPPRARRISEGASERPALNLLDSNVTKLRYEVVDELGGKKGKAMRPGLTRGRSEDSTFQGYAVVKPASGGKGNESPISEVSPPMTPSTILSPSEADTSVVSEASWPHSLSFDALPVFPSPPNTILRKTPSPSTSPAASPMPYSSSLRWSDLASRSDLYSLNSPSYHSGPLAGSVTHTIISPSQSVAT
ncbi:hypothetical protein P7C70_g9321, partial [Phenoliferia sp. Uapishka_3]